MKSLACKAAISPGVPSQSGKWPQRAGKVFTDSVTMECPYGQERLAAVYQLRNRREPATGWAQLQVTLTSTSCSMGSLRHF